MISKMLNRSLTWGLMAVVLGTCWGCAYSPEEKYEERYRLFFAKQLPIDASPTDSIEQISQKFIPEIGVQRSMEAFAEEGFKLHKIETIEWGEGATLFTFRRNVGSELLPARAQIQYVGVFRVDDDQPEPTYYYVLAQGHDDYTVNVRTADGVKTFKALWDGRQLVWNDEAGRNYGRLNPDGSELYHLIENPTGFDLPRERTLLKAQRVVPQQEPGSYENREARRYTVRLKPETPRYYAPFPW